MKPDWAALRTAALEAAHDAGATRAVAEDAAQDALERVFELLLELVDVRDLEAYVRQMAFRRARRLAVRESRRERGIRGLELAWACVDDVEPEARIDARRALELVAASSEGGDDERLRGTDGRSRVWRHRLWRVVTGATGVGRPPQGLKPGGGAASGGAPTRRSGSPRFFSDT